jgi:hypothetical protein
MDGPGSIDYKGFGFSDSGQDQAIRADGSCFRQAQGKLFGFACGGKNSMGLRPGEHSQLNIRPLHGGGVSTGRGYVSIGPKLRIVGKICLKHLGFVCDCERAAAS